MEALLRVIHEFLLYHVKQAHKEEADLDGAVTKGISMFYIHSTVALDGKDSIVPTDQKNATISEFAGTASLGAQRRISNNPDVNQYIVEVEMKKF